MSNTLAWADVRGRSCFFASLALLFYDHVTTLDQEVSYFWSGQWTLSRVLYLSIRYLTVLNLISMLLSYFAVLSSLGCAGTAIIVYILTCIIVFLSQAILTFRVWYLFTHNRHIQAIVAYIFLVCIISQIILVGIMSHDTTLGHIYMTGDTSVCGYIPPTTVWHSFIPALFLHVTMYVLTVYRVVNNTTSVVSKAFVQRFVEEGAPLYLVATASLIMVFGFAITETQTITIFIDSYYFFAVITVAVCHALLSIRTLAAKLRVDPTWLLSQNELSRLYYRQGLNDAELLVEVGGQYEGDNIELRQVENGQEKVEGGGITQLPSKSCVAVATARETSASPSFSPI